MLLEEYLNIYIFIKIVYICDIQNLYDKMAWPSSDTAYFKS